MGKLGTGSKAPSFELYNQNGDLVNFSKYLGEFPIVLYFYPKNFTPGCTAQACSFRDQYADFKDVGAIVFGISSDSVESHKRFGKKHNLPFDTLADEKGNVRKLYGVKPDLLGLIPGRETFIIDTEGIIRLKFHSMTSGKHISKSLEILKGL